MKSLLPMLMALVCFPASARGDRPNSNCEWPGETAVSLDLSKSGQQQHLADDAQGAEDLAIRYADSHSGPRSGHFAGFDEYRRTREQCMAALFAVIANTHGVTREQVRESLAHRRTSVVSLGGVLLGEIWSFTAENFRVGNGHLSYRVNRIPWTQHRLGLFAGGVVLFWLLAWLHHRQVSGTFSVPGLGPHSPESVDSV